MDMAESRKTNRFGLFPTEHGFPVSFISAPVFLAE